MDIRTIVEQHSVTPREAADDLVRKLGGPQEPIKHAFIASRYPYTYACDFLREHSAHDMSRSEASGWLRTAAQEAGINRDALAVELADRYLRSMGWPAPK